MIALLALVASVRDRGISRDRVLAVLWPDADPEKARQALTQALYHARRALGSEELFIASADLRLNSQVISADVWEFEDALRDRQLERAAALYEGPLLDGFFVTGAPEFERWAEEERARLLQRFAEVLEQLARDAEARADRLSAVRWRKRRAALDPLNSRSAMDLMLAYARAGDRASALQHARVHEELLRQELDVAPQPEVTQLTEQLREEAMQGPVDRAESAVPVARDGLEAAVDGTSSSASPVPPNGREVIATSHHESLVVRLMDRGVIRDHKVGLFATIAAVALGVIVVVLLLSAPAVAPAAPNTLIVAPFRVSGADPALAYLREGLVDLLATRLSEDTAMRAADAGSVMSAWRRAGLDTEGGASRGEALDLAERLGARRMLLGSVVGMPARMVISASLLDVGDSTLRAQASVEGPSDSLTTMVDRLVARLVATEAGAGDRLADQTTTSARALRAYLAVRAEYRRGRYRESIRQFRSALDRDSAFGLAALGLAQSADRIGAQADVARGLAAAWAVRAELGERDRVYFEALAGPRYPAPSSERERLEAWERATGAASDRAEVWHEYGKRLFHDGRLLGVSEWRQRATAAFRRAAELDPGFASPVQYLLQLAAAQGDTAEVRRTTAAYFRLDSVGELVGFVRWRSAVAFLDTVHLRSIRGTFSSMSGASLRAIALSSVFNGVEIADAQRALLILRERSARGADRREILLAEHALAVNRGKPASALRTLQSLENAQPQSSVAERLRVLDALYGDIDSPRADSVAARVAVDVLNAAARHTKTRLAAGPISRAMREDWCVAGQWYAWRGTSRDAAALAEPLSIASGGSEDGLSTVCIALLESIIAVRASAPDAPVRLARYDSLVTVGPAADAMSGYAFLALARLYAERGDEARALLVSRRRPHLREWPHYLASQLREEGRLALAARDTAGAITAFRHYLKLREGADDDVRARVDNVREELERMDSAAKRATSDALSAPPMTVSPGGCCAAVGSLSGL